MSSRPLSATPTKRMAPICLDGGLPVKLPKGEFTMNNILKTAVLSFSDACSWGTDFHKEHASRIYNR